MTEPRAVDNQPMIGDERRVLTHDPVHASAHRRRTDLEDVRRATGELEARVAGTALTALLVGDQVTVGRDDLEADDGVRAPHGRVARRDADDVAGDDDVDADLGELFANASHPVARWAASPVRL